MNHIDFELLKKYKKSEFQGPIKRKIRKFLDIHTDGNYISMNKNSLNGYLKMFDFLGGEICFFKYNQKIISFFNRTQYVRNEKYISKFKILATSNPEKKSEIKCLKYALKSFMPYPQFRVQSFFTKDRKFIQLGIMKTNDLLKMINDGMYQIIRFDTYGTEFLEVDWDEAKEKYKLYVDEIPREKLKNIFKPNI